MKDTFFLNNTHFIHFDKWFENLDDKTQTEIIQNYGGLEKYLGIELVNEFYDEEKGFEFKIVNQDRLTEASLDHDFLNNL